MPGTFKTEAVVLRSIRFSEADCVLHLYTLERGRVGAIAKGVRKTKSRFGARRLRLTFSEVPLRRTRWASPLRFERNSWIRDKFTTLDL